MHIYIYIQIINITCDEAESMYERCPDASIPAVETQP